MRIVVTVRTLNEAAYIEKFCEAYQFADQICVADGGSTDNTIELAKQFPNVQVRNYDVKVECKNGIYRNPDGPHIQFLVDWATEEGADWIIHQDCDQRPNKYLKEDARDILATTNKDFVQATQIFFWGRDKYFRELSFFGDWVQGLWAWRADVGLKIIDKMPHYEFSLDGKQSIDILRTNRHQNLSTPPYCFIHYCWEDADKTQSHVEYYCNSGLIKEMLHPRDFGGKLFDLEVWMAE